MSHIEQRRRLWYATLKVPEGLREKVGRTKFLQSLGTPDKRRAEILAAPVVAMWKARLRQAEGEGGAVLQEALRWREAVAEEKGSGDWERSALIESLLADKAYGIEEKHGTEAAQRFADVALGSRTPSALHLDAWKASIGHLAPKTQNQMTKDVQQLVNEFSTLEDVTPQAARQWVDRLQQAGASESSTKRMLSFWRSYWRHLESAAAVPPKSWPFEGVVVRKSPKAPEDQRMPFKPAEVVKLWKAAGKGGDAELADLIQLGAYTGARIEELCSLKVEDVSAKAFTIRDAKTQAGIREVPIHSALRPPMARLKKASADGYLLSGLTFNKYGDRSNAIGKRFGRLKDTLGFGPGHVFHSLRKTLITMLENAGVSENLAADIVGHEKPRITYGLYSGGHTLVEKAKALELVKYPAR